MKSKTLFVIIMMMIVIGGVCRAYTVDEFKQLDLSSLDLSYSDYSVEDGVNGLLYSWQQNSLVEKNNVDITNVTTYYKKNITVYNTTYYIKNNGTYQNISKSIVEKEFSNVTFFRNYYITYEPMSVNKQFFISQYDLDKMSDDKINDKVLLRQETVKNQTLNVLKLQQDKLNGIQSQRLSLFQNFRNNILRVIGLR